MKNVANWWGLGKITDDDFLKILEYSIKNDVIKFQIIHHLKIQMN